MEARPSIVRRPPPATTEQQILERALPAHMLALVLESLKARGLYEVEDDLTHRLNLAAVEPLKTCDGVTAKLYARRIDDTARALLRPAGADEDLLGALLSVMLFNLKLVDEGVFADTQNQGVLIALLLVDDQERNDWETSREAAAGRADRMFFQARMLGLYWGDSRQSSFEQV